MKPINKAVHDASKLLAKRAKLAKLIQHYMGQLVEMDAELCDCLTASVQTFGSDAGIEGDPVIELKE